MSAPTLTATIRFATGPAFGNVLELGSPTDGILGTNVLGTTANKPVDITGSVRRASVRRGRSRVLDKFEAGTATVEIIDTDGTFDPDNGPYAGEILPLRQVRLLATHDGTTRYLFSGYIERYTYKYDVGSDVAYLTLACVDTFRLLNLTKITTITGAVAGETTGSRIERIFDQLDWPTSLLDIDTGDTTLQADSGADRTVLAAIQQMENAELGAFYMLPSGVVRYQSRTSTIVAGGVTPVEFDDDGTDVSYNAIDLAIDDTLLANKVTVTRQSGTPQTVSDSTSIETYFERNLERTGLLMETDTEALQQARAVLAARKDPALRIGSVALNLADGNTDRINAALDIGFFSPVTINRTQPGGGIVSRTLTVQGIQHDITPDRWVTRLSTAEPIATGFILSSPRLGVLGEDTLAY